MVERRLIRLGALVWCREACATPPCAFVTCHSPTCPAMPSSNAPPCPALPCYAMLCHALPRHALPWQQHTPTSSPARSPAVDSSRPAAHKTSTLPAACMCKPSQPNSSLPASLAARSPRTATAPPPGWRCCHRWACKIKRQRILSTLQHTA